MCRWFSRRTRKCLLGLLVACGEAELSPDAGPHASREADAHASAGRRANTSALRDAAAAESARDASAADSGRRGDADVLGVDEDTGVNEPYSWRLPPGFPEPVVPEDNPMTEAKVQLGRRLFYDDRLSDNRTMSCASCHEQRLAFTDGLAQSRGATGELHPRSAMSLANVAYAASLTWANPLFAMGVLREPLERQAVLPMYGDSPVELGLKSQAQIELRLREVPQYVDWFSEAFPDQEQPITAQNINRALAAFQRTMLSGSSPFDRYAQGLDPDALSESAKRGHTLFNSERLACSQCHSGFNLSDHVYHRGLKTVELVYHNTGLYNVDGLGAYPEPNTGVYGVTLNPDEMGMFKVPTLRNVALTAPYMHDGSIATLTEVIDHYEAGGRTLTDGAHAGVGSDNPYKDPRLQGFTLSAQERADLLEFLASLTDQAFIEDESFSDPWR